MNRHAAWALFLLWSASSWAQEPPRPNLSGTWTLVRSQSSGQIGTGSMVLRIDQKGDRVTLSRTFSEQEGRSETSSIEIRTDGRETLRKEAHMTYFDQASWEGNRLAVVSRFEGGYLGGGTTTSMHSLSPDGRTLTIEDRFKSSRLEYEETWVFRRTDGEPSPAWPRLTLKPLGYGRVNGHYPAGEPIHLQLIFTNDQPVPVELWLKDHDKEGSQDPLWSLAARIEDEQGKILTRDECCRDSDDWWSSAIFTSDSCGRGECEMPGDYVTLAPGQTVLRTAELNALAWRCPGLVKMGSHTLPAGSYDVQLTVDGLVSEPLRIVVD